jgi:hypothetical protein
VVSFARPPADSRTSRLAARRRGRTPAGRRAPDGTRGRQRTTSCSNDSRETRLTPNHRAEDTRKTLAAGHGPGRVGRPRNSSSSVPAPCACGVAHLDRLAGAGVVLRGAGLTRPTRFMTLGLGEEVSLYHAVRKGVSTWLVVSRGMSRELAVSGHQFQLSWSRGARRPIIGGCDASAQFKRGLDRGRPFF